MKNPREDLIEGLIQARKEFGSETKDYVSITKAIEFLAIPLEPIDERELEKICFDHISLGTSEYYKMLPINLAHAIATKFGVSKIEPIDEK